MKYSNILWIFLISLIIAVLLSNIVFSIGISPAYYEIKFKPNLEQTFGFKALNSASGVKDIEFYVKGDLAEYATLSKTKVENAPPGVFLPFAVTLKLPENLDDNPGMKRLLVGAREGLPKVQAGIAARAAIQAVIYIDVPYPGKYVNVDYIVPNIETGQTAYFSLALTSKGKEFIHKAKAEIEVYDGDNNTLAKVYTNEVSLAPEETKQLLAEWVPSNPIPGEYRAVAKVTYDEQDKIIEKRFNIGDLIVEIVNTTQIFYKDTINEFNVYVISKWNNALSNVHSEINIYSAGEKIDKILSPTIELPGWKGHVLTAYWNARGLEAGTYRVEVIVPYASKIAKKEFDVQLLETQPVKEEKPAVVVDEEKPEKTYAFSWTTILIIIIALLIIINIVWLFYSSKNKYKR